MLFMSLSMFGSIGSHSFTEMRFDFGVQLFFFSNIVIWILRSKWMEYSTLCREI